MIRLFARTLALVFLFSFHSSEVNEVQTPRWVIWNVGQGSWLTRIEDRHCFHFDAGGDRKLPKDPLRVCRYLKNILVVSHTDWDHVSYARQLANQVRNFCVDDRTLFNLPRCSSHRKWWSWSPDFPVRSKNDSSQVILFKGLLYPGDSPAKYEKYWLGRLPEAPRVLLLAHHGSRTGTSKKLVSSLHGLKMAIASARNRKYGHPHPTVVARLAQAKIPLLLTESWGNIHILDPVTAPARDAMQESVNRIKRRKNEPQALK